MLFWRQIFEIPNVEPLRSKIISNIGLKFRHFKSRLTTKYIFAKLKGEIPCLKYKHIDEETWCLFKESCENEAWMVSEVT